MCNVDTCYQQQRKTLHPQAATGGLGAGPPPASPPLCKAQANTSMATPHAGTARQVMMHMHRMHILQQSATACLSYTPSPLLPLLCTLFASTSSDQLSVKTTKRLPGTHKTATTPRKPPLQNQHLEKILHCALLPLKPLCLFRRLFFIRRLFLKHRRIHRSLWCRPSLELLVGIDHTHQPPACILSWP